MSLSKLCHNHVRLKGSEFFKHLTGTNNLKGRLYRTNSVYTGKAYPHPSLTSHQQHHQHQCHTLSPHQSVQYVGSTEYWRSTQTRTLHQSVPVWSEIKNKDNDSEKRTNENSPIKSDASSDGSVITEGSTGIFTRFKNAYKEYGKVLVGVHAVTSCVWLGGFYYAAKSGLDVIPLLERMGASDTVIKPFKSSGVGHLAVAYLLYKLATPARYAVTIGGTQLTTKMLRNYGYMKVVPKGDSLRQLMKDGRVQIKEKTDNLKERTTTQIKETSQKMRTKSKDRK